MLPPIGLPLCIVPQGFGVFTIISRIAVIVIINNVVMKPIVSAASSRRRPIIHGASAPSARRRLSESDRPIRVVPAHPSTGPPESYRPIRVAPAHPSRTGPSESYRPIRVVPDRQRLARVPLPRSHAALSATNRRSSSLVCNKPSLTPRRGSATGATSF